jgi:co-chaperonin GroES (HSP10)
MRQAGMPRAEENWITGDEVPDPNPLPTVVGWKLLIRPVAIKTKTKGGILLPDQYKDDVQYLTTVGRVLAMGEQAYRHKDFEVEETKTESGVDDGETFEYSYQAFNPKPWCKVGDYVCYGKFAGTKFIYRGVKLLLLEDRLVDMVVPDPGSIDPQYNISQG